MENKEEIKSVSMNVGMEDENEILELQQAVLVSNIDDKNVARIIGKLQKLYELTKYNTNSRLFSDLFYKQPHLSTSGYVDMSFNEHAPLYATTGSPISKSDISLTDVTLTPKVSVSNDLPNDIPF